MKAWWRRSHHALEASPTEPLEVFRVALDAAREREERVKPLFDQLAFAMRTAESPVPIDRATVPLHLALGPARIKELAAQIKLSIHLKSNIRALLDHFRDDQAELAKGERALTLLARRPDLQVHPEALPLINGLFRILAATREVFHDYPLFYDLFADIPLEQLEPRARDDDDEPRVPQELSHLVTDEAPTVSGGEFASPDDELDAFEPEGLHAELTVLPIELELGLDLVPLADPALGGTLMQKLGPMRVDIAQDLGYVFPALRTRDNVELRPNAYVVRVRGTVVASGELLTGYMLAVESPQAEPEPEDVVGFPTRDPVTQRAAMWVPGSVGVRMRQHGNTVLDCVEVLARHLDATIRRHAHEMFTLEELVVVLDCLRDRQPQTIEAVLGDKLELADYHLILKNLLREGVSIRDQVTILETLAVAAKPVHPFYLADHFGQNRASMEHMMLLEMAAQMKPLTDPAILTEIVRVRLARQICASLASTDGTLDVVLLDASVEGLLLNSIQTTTMGQSLELATTQRELFVGRLLAQCGHQEQPILLCDAKVRPHLRALTERELPHLRVLSYREVHPSFQAQGIGTVSLVGS
ncbi:MAG: FHIPEP family type III secretion protein [Candidatus Sericytochromatia bacterium]|nr:FHIPEP family type III secretion protein [Candidatus Sericytochromatia bacterium]